MSDSNEHAKYAASSAERRAKCPGSVNASQGIPALPSSPWSKEGTKAHKVLETAIENQVQAEEAWDFLAMQSPIEISGEKYTYDPFNKDGTMIDGVQLALDHIHSVLPSGIISAEVKVHLPSDAANGNAWGTCDVRGYEPSTKTLHILDFKYGVGFVPAYQNRQLAQYGVSTYFSGWAKLYDIEHVEMTIIQPRNFDEGSLIRSWNASPDEMFKWLDILDSEIAATQKADAPCIPGDHCKYCAAEVNCSAKQNHVLAIAGMKNVQTLAVSAPPEPKTLDAFRLALIMNAKKQVMSWFDAVEAHAHEMIRLGQPVPGYKLVEAQTRRQWFGDPNAVAQSLSELTGENVDKVYPRKLIGITEAEKLVSKAAKRKGVKAEELKVKMAFLTSKEGSGNTALAPETDSRPPIDIAHVSFQQVKQIGE